MRLQRYEPMRRQSHEFCRITRKCGQFVPQFDKLCQSTWPHSAKDRVQLLMRSNVIGNDTQYRFQPQPLCQKPQILFIGNAEQGPMRFFQSQDQLAIRDGQAA